jgi:hypothetical protein
MYTDFKDRNYFRILDKSILANFVDRDSKAYEVTCPSVPYFYVLCRNTKAQREYMGIVNELPVSAKDLVMQTSLESTSLEVAKLNAYGCAEHSNINNNGVDILQSFRDGSKLYINTSIFEWAKQQFKENLHQKTELTAPWPVLSTYLMCVDTMRIVDALFNFTNDRKDKLEYINNDNTSLPFLGFELTLGIEFGKQDLYGLWKPGLVPGRSWQGYTRWFGPITFYEDTTSIHFTLDNTKMQELANCLTEERWQKSAELIRPFFDSLFRMAVPTFNSEYVVYHGR